MTPKDRLVTVREGASREEVITKLQEHRIEKVLVVHDKFSLRGMITVKDIQKTADLPRASKDEAGRLSADAPLGTGAGTDERGSALVGGGEDLHVGDAAHGPSSGVHDPVPAIQELEDRRVGKEWARTGRTLW